MNSKQLGFHGAHPNHYTLMQFYDSAPLFYDPVNDPLLQVCYKPKIYQVFDITKFVSGSYLVHLLLRKILCTASLVGNNVKEKSKSRHREKQKDQWAFSS